MIRKTWTGKPWWTAPAAVAGVSLIVLSWQAHEVRTAGVGCGFDALAGMPTVAPRIEQVSSGQDPLTVLGVGAVVLAAQMFFGRRPGRCPNRAVRLTATAIAALICVALLVTGHQAPRSRSPKHESLEGSLLRDRPAAVSYEDASNGRPVQRA